MAAAPAPASPTGLNNIPTADTPGDRELVFQSWATFGDELATDWVLGFKGGLWPWGQRIEYGADMRVGEGGSDPLVLQFKYALALSELLPTEHPGGAEDNGGSGNSLALPTLAVGVSNLALTSSNRREVGQPATYLVATQDFKWFRGTVGYQFQHQNDAAFFGFDKTFSVFERDFQFRTDFRQVSDPDQWLGSAGFIWFLHKHVAVESWVSVPFEHGEPTFTLKLNLGLTF
ncbi:MAG: hypothetical protein ACYS0D_14465 [Planctomycetota bacterium]